jgi:hypothetical protein
VAKPIDLDQPDIVVPEREIVGEDMAGGGPPLLAHDGEDIGGAAPEPDAIRLGRQASAMTRSQPLVRISDIVGQRAIDIRRALLGQRIDQPAERRLARPDAGNDRKALKPSAERHQADRASSSASQPIT